MIRSLNKKLFAKNIAREHDILKNDMIETLQKALAGSYDSRHNEKEIKNDVLEYTEDYINKYSSPYLPKYTIPKTKKKHKEENKKETITCYNAEEKSDPFFKNPLYSLYKIFFYQNPEYLWLLKETKYKINQNKTAKTSCAYFKKDDKIDIIMGYNKHHSLKNTNIANTNDNGLYRYGFYRLSKILNQKPQEILQNNPNPTLILLYPDDIPAHDLIDLMHKTNDLYNFSLTTEEKFQEYKTMNIFCSKDDIKNYIGLMILPNNSITVFIKNTNDTQNIIVITEFYSTITEE